MDIGDHGQNSVSLLLQAIDADFTGADFKLSDEYYYSCVPLCIIDSVFSIQSRYPTTQAVVRRWAGRAGWPLFRKHDTEEHTVSEFLEIATKYDSETLAKEWFGNRQRTSSTNGILKADAVVQFAKCLASNDIEKFSDIGELQCAKNAEICVRRIRGQSSGVTWKYFQMLAGNENTIKPDTWVCRYVARVLGRGAISAADAESVLLAAIDKMKRDGNPITARQIDHAIWNLERRRG